MASHGYVHTNDDLDDGDNDVYFAISNERPASSATQSVRPPWRYAGHVWFLDCNDDCRNSIASARISLATESEVVKF